jgi:hypothetical protein
VAGHLWSSLAFQRIRFNGGAPSAQAVVSETGPVSKEAGIRDKTYLNVQALLLRSFQPIRSAFLNAPTRATRSDRAAFEIRISTRKPAAAIILTNVSSPNGFSDAWLCHVEQLGRLRAEVFWLRRPAYLTI